MKLSDDRLRPYAWGVLVALFASLLAGLVLYGRTDWPRPALLSGEATYLLQAESLAYDLDLAYTAEDYHRSVVFHHGEPPDLALASGSDGRRITYDRPFPYALWLAPFVRLWPEKGFVAANLLALAAAAFTAVRALGSAAGPTAPFWVAVLLFASVAWSYVRLATGDLFLFAVVVVALSLMVKAREREERLAGGPTRPSRAWLAAGALLAVPVATEPLYGILAAGAFFVVPKKTRGPGRSAFLLGAALALTAVVALQWWWSGGLHFFATTRFRFTPETGFPLIDFTAADWAASVKRYQALYWEGAPRFSWGVDPLLWLWDAVYLAVGRHIGILPYYLPLALLGLGGSLAGHRRPLVLAAAVWLAAVVVVHPFNLYGGEGAIANRLFLPVYGALWLVLARRPHPVLGVATAALSSLFLWNLWSAPWAPPIAAGTGYAYVTPIAERWLPFETSQRRIPANQRADHLGLRLSLLNEGVWAETRRELLFVDERRRAKMVIASPVELPSFDLEFDSDAPGEIVLRGARLEEKILLADGGISFRVRPTGFASRRHAMWWTPERQWLYPLDLELPGDDEPTRPLAFQIYSERVLEDGAR